MKDPGNGPYYTTKKLAQLTGLSPSYFEKARCRNDGPAYIKIGSKVLYSQCDIEQWMQGARRLPGGRDD